MTPKYTKTRSFRATRGVCACCVGGAALLLLGCEKEQPKSLTASEPTPATATAAATGPVVNPEIAEAVAQAAETESTGSAENAPPPNGILGTSRAEAEAPAGVPLKVVLGAAGSDPKVKLGGPEITDERIGQMTVSARMGPNAALPSVAFKFELAGQEVEEEAAAPGLLEVKVSVVEAKLAQQQPGNIPKELEDAIGQMKDSRLHYRSKDGRLTGAVDAELGKKADQRTESLIGAAADALRSALIAYPSEPVGQGAIWMMTAREKLALGEVVGYHMVKVEKIEGVRVTLSVNTKRYLVNEEFQGLPAVRFLGTGTSDLVVMPGHRLPIEGRVQHSMQALLQQQNGQPRPFQFELRALFSFPPKTADEADGDGADGPAAGVQPGAAAPGAAQPSAQPTQ